jgi:hypothetical protein
MLSDFEFSSQVVEALGYVAETYSARGLASELGKSKAN